MNHYKSLLSRLQAEVDLVPQNGIYNECDKLLELIGAPRVGLDSLSIPDVVKSTRHLMETCHVLEEALAREKERLEVQQTAIMELKAIQDKLRQLVEETVASKDDSLREGDKMSEDEDPSTGENDLSQQLQSDLKYVAQCIMQQSTGGLSASSVEDKSLEKTVNTLVDKCFMASTPEDAYISTVDEGIPTQIVGILKQSCVVETFKHDANLIRLIDYRS